MIPFAARSTSAKQINSVVFDLGMVVFGALQMNATFSKPVGCGDAVQTDALTRTNEIANELSYVPVATVEPD